MDKNELFDFYSKLYFHELETKEKYNSRLQFPLVVIVSLLSFSGYIFSGINKWAFDNLFALSTILFIIGNGGILVSCYYFVRSYVSNSYYVLPYPTHIEKYRADMVEYYKDIACSQRYVEDKLKGEIFQWMVTASTDNGFMNKERTYMLHNFNKWSIGSVLCLMCSFVLSQLAAKLQ
ncbi:hypothetical protein [Fundidesulfovibrio putealis]|uniref:hypothetical protein n=1 Tax=Fundidesulfovibrio putealis TaxID=270496 RepID=UPI0012EC3075|nr:hypothetical protein [Fundidesulfovibrio putealis]